MFSLYNQLAPWDENSLFESPVLTNFSLGGGGTVQIAKYNPRRIGLWVSTGSNTAWIAPGTTLTSGATINTQQGIPVTTQNSPIMIHQDSWGVLAAMDWTAVNVTGAAQPAQIGVVELLLRDLPPKENKHEALASVLRSSGVSNGKPPAARTIKQQIWDMVFSASRGEGNNRG